MAGKQEATGSPLLLDEKCHDLDKQERTKSNDATSEVVAAKKRKLDADEFETSDFAAKMMVI